MATIPKIIHTIWIGNKKRPEGSKIWADMNPEYEHMHWDEAKLNTDLSGSLDNEYVKMYLSREDKQYSDKYNGAVNVLRLLVLQKYGGIYFDADCVPMRPLTDDLLDNEFFSVHENEIYCPGTIANGIIGCTPSHFIINKMVSDLAGCPIATQRSWIATGPMFLTRSLK
jgi:mannosyltransferase OCH1-like enzyme